MKNILPLAANCEALHLLLDELPLPTMDLLVEPATLVSPTGKRLPLLHWVNLGWLGGVQQQQNRLSYRPRQADETGGRG